MWMECLKCGRRSAGIEIEPASPQEELDRYRLNLLVRIGENRRAA